MDKKFFISMAGLFLVLVLVNLANKYIENRPAIKKITEN